MSVYALTRFQKKERGSLALFGEDEKNYFLPKISIGQMVVTA
jgi:hypothetical protein